MRRPTGLQAKMTASYVVVTAAAVLLVEAVAIGLLVPSAVSATDLNTRVQSTAAALADRTSTMWAKQGQPPSAADFPFGSAVAPAQPGTAQDDGSGGIVVNRVSDGYQAGQAPVVTAVLMGLDGTVLASSYPAEYPVGSRPPLPYDPTKQYKGSGTGKTDGGQIVWAALPVPIETTPSKAVSPGKSPSPTKSDDASSVLAKFHGSVFVQVSAGATVTASPDLGPSLRIAAFVLALLIPVGAVFGFLSTRRTVRRVRRLEESTARVAGGDLAQRVDVSGHDELAGLESGFNAMAEQLQDSLEAERQLSGSAARAAERTRIARELHDSVSQDVFSLGLLAGGLRKALPDGSPLRSEVEAMERTSKRALREMQALLLELRPVAMEELGLSDALAELCRAYRMRLGITVEAEIGVLDTTPAVEHGVLRIVQEAMANAVKHGDPASVSLSVQQANGSVTVRVRDDGVGFDPEPGAGAGLGLGLGSMRDRVAELGGQLVVESGTGAGTTVSAVIPARGPR